MIWLIALDNLIDENLITLFTMIKESTEILLRLLILVPLSMRILKNTGKFLKKIADILNLGYPGNHVGPISPGTLRLKENSDILYKVIPGF